MNSTKPQTHRSRVSSPDRASRANLPPLKTSAPVPLIVDTHRSHQTSLIFKTLLGIAACIALVGVVVEATTTGSASNVEADPPTVFVEID